MTKPYIEITANILSLMAGIQSDPFHTYIPQEVIKV